MIPFLFAAEDAAQGAAEAAHGAAESGSPLDALAVNGVAFTIQLITFLFVFLLLKKFAFAPIVKMLEERRKVIDDGVRMGLKMEKAKQQLDQDIAKELQKTRQEADKIIAGAKKEEREIIREAEKTAQRKTDAMLADAEVRLQEEAKRAKRGLEKDIVGLVSEATEAIVHEKVDSTKDAKLIDEALKGRKK
jgi:F-type H+-transporting ATPase subunit b